MLENKFQIILVLRSNIIVYKKANVLQVQLEQTVRVYHKATDVL